MLDKFIKALENNGDVYVRASFDDDTELEQIRGVLEVQGFWAGISDRYYFDKDFNLIRTEERRFGL